MAERAANHIISKLRSRRRVYSLLGDLLLTLGIAFLITIITWKFWAWSPCWGIIVWLLLFILLGCRQHFWKYSDDGIAKSLDQRYTELEESSLLLLRPLESLNQIERLQ